MWRTSNILEHMSRKDCCSFSCINQWYNLNFCDIKIGITNDKRFLDLSLSYKRIAFIFFHFLSDNELILFSEDIFFTSETGWLWSTVVRDLRPLKVTFYFVLFCLCVGLVTARAVFLFLGTGVPRILPIPNNTCV